MQDAVSERTTLLMRAHVRMRNIPADTGYRVVQDIVRMSDDNNKGFDSTLQILEPKFNSRNQRIAFHCSPFLKE
jgi:hypothetical protein